MCVARFTVYIYDCFCANISVRRLRLGIKSNKKPWRDFVCLVTYLTDLDPPEDALSGFWDLGISSSAVWTGCSGIFWCQYLCWDSGARPEQYSVSESSSPPPPSRPTTALDVGSGANPFPSDSVMDLGVGWLHDSRRVGRPSVGEMLSLLDQCAFGRYFCDSRGRRRHWSLHVYVIIIIAPFYRWIIAGLCLPLS